MLLLVQNKQELFTDKQTTSFTVKKAITCSFLFDSKTEVC